MRPTLRRLLARSKPDCRRWMDVPSTATLLFADGFADRYVRTLRPMRADSPSALAARAGDRLLRFRIFPPHRVEPTVCTPDGYVAPDALIVVRIGLGPFAVETADRVVDVVRRDPDRDGTVAAFTYVTLAGHPEQGYERFAIERQGDRVSLVLEARSRPAGLLARLGRPVARWFQVRSTHEALEDFARAIAEGA